MCILFVYRGCEVPESDYSLIVASNRDEFYDRPALSMAPWSEDPNVIGGLDLEVGRGGGTWLAVSPQRKKLGVLLNLPGSSRKDAKSRGKIAADYVKCDSSTIEYVESLKDYCKECNDFILATVEFGKTNSTLQTYCNATNKVDTWMDICAGFGNSLPDAPLKKVEAGKNKMKEICSKFNKIEEKPQLVKELVDFLRSQERYLPDPELEKRRPTMYKELSSVFVCVPVGRYGTRTHTIVLVTKTGHMDVIEVTLQAPVDPLNPKWKTTEFQFDI